MKVCGGEGNLRVPICGQVTRMSQVLGCSGECDRVALTPHLGSRSQDTMLSQCHGGQSSWEEGGWWFYANFVC